MKINFSPILYFDIQNPTGIRQTGYGSKHGYFLLTMQDGQVLKMELNGICMGWTPKKEKGVIAYKSHTLFSSKSKQKIDILFDYLIKSVWSGENISRVTKGENIPVEIADEILEGIKKH